MIESITFPKATNLQESTSDQAAKAPKSAPRTLAFHDRADVRKNQIGVHVLYVQIMKEYLRRLMERYEDQRNGPFSNEQEVQRFYSGIKYYYNQSHLAYTRCVRQRQTGRGTFVKDEEKQEEEQYQFFEEEEPIEEESEQFVPFQMPELFNTHYVPRIVMPKQEQPRVKLQSIPPTLPSTPSPKDEQEDTSSNSDSDSQDMIFYGQRAERRTNCLLTGNFVLNKIKRKPKEEKIIVELQNIFIKFAHNGRDAFYDRGTLELRKIEKSEVPIE